MTTSTQSWTNRQILDVFLARAVEDCYSCFSWSPEAFEQFQTGTNDLHQIKTHLASMQIGAIASLLGILDGRNGPSNWPGIKLVNAETGESLSSDLQWDLSRAEARFLSKMEKRQD
jgi:hypothetical protein